MSVSESPSKGRVLRSRRDSVEAVYQGMDRRIERRGRRFGRTGFFVIGLMAIGWLVYFLVFGENRRSVRVERERLVVSTVSRGAFQELIPINGVVIPIRMTFLTAIEGGRVEELFVEAGAMVAKGDPILELSNTNLLVDIMWREAEVFQQSNSLRTTRLLMEQHSLQLRKEIIDVEEQLRRQARIHARYLELSKGGVISQNELELARDQHSYLLQKKELTVESQENDAEFRKAQVEALESSLQRMQDNLDLVKKKLEALVVRAPVSGHLTSLDAEVGQSKAPGERLGQIDILDGFKIRAAVDEHYLGRVRIGRSARFDLDGKNYHVVVRKIYPEVRQGRFEIDLEFADRRPESTRRGQTLHLRLELSDSVDAVLLDRGGFFQATGGNWAYVLDGTGNVARKRSIEIGRQNPAAFEILGGLRPGDRVITSSYEGFGTADELVLNQTPNE